MDPTPATPPQQVPAPSDHGGELTLAQIEAIAKGAMHRPEAVKAQPAPVARPAPTTPVVQPAPPQPAPTVAPARVATPAPPPVAEPTPVVPTSRVLPMQQKVIQPVVPTEVAPMTLPTVEAPAPPPPPKPDKVPVIIPLPVAETAPVETPPPPEIEEAEKAAAAAKAQTVVSPQDAAAMSTPPPVPPPIVTPKAPPPKEHHPHLIGKPRTKPLDELSSEKAVMGAFGASTGTIYLVRKLLWGILIAAAIFALWLLYKTGQLTDWWLRLIVEPIHRMSQPN